MFLMSLRASSGRTRSFLFGLHLWEVCMSGILRRIQPHGYEAGTLGRVLFNVVLDGCCLLIEHGVPLMIRRSHVLVYSDWH